MTETTDDDAPPTPVDTNEPVPDPVEEPPSDPTPDPGPVEGDPEFCTSVYPHDPAITCQRPYGHSVRMIHCRQTGGPDSPYYEWE